MHRPDWEHRSPPWSPSTEGVRVRRSMHMHLCRDRPRTPSIQPCLSDTRRPPGGARAHTIYRCKGARALSRGGGNGTHADARGHNSLHFATSANGRHRNYAFALFPPPVPILIPPRRRAAFEFKTESHETPARGAAVAQMYYAMLGGRYSGCKFFASPMHFSVP